ncbi:uncharacterized protein LOC122380836 [Amphibalanus amphitrite]|uniref:uncharacterized protein LOC122380836 n=1 Tax=Amphibalanus amphitrite TaxID=1232801 RepID=UPI001C914420|nr:uncharacterized protein LOC122380836 [Amphibalanus amphitrite]
MPPGGARLQAPPPVVVRRTRGRAAGGGVVKGGDVALYLRAGLQFAALTCPLLHPNDNSTEVCGVRLLGDRPLTIINLYGPPIRATDLDTRMDNFYPSALPADNHTLLVGDFNAHHPMWDHGCDAADAVGARVAAWLGSVGWTTLNSGEPTQTHVSYRNGSQTAPDLIACSDDLARRATWHLGPDIGSDHLPMVAQVATSNHGSRCIRKPRWSFKKADWAAFQAECEAAFEEAEPSLSTQELSTLFVNVLHQASVHHIPRGARADPKPWALDPELREAIAERREVSDPKPDRAAQRTARQHSRCAACEDTRTGCCGAFSMEELVSQLRRCQLRKSPGPDELSAEHLKHLGPIARGALLRLINLSWLEGVVPQEWRRAVIVPIPKSGKDKRKIASYRPIALTSHIAKLMERLVLAGLTFITDQLKIIPPEQVGFREKRSVEDNLGRLIQEVLDGWNRPRSRRLHTPDGQSAQKFVLLAFDFSGAYDTVDHRLLRARLLDQGLPRCFVRWVWQFLRDRRACMELNGARSSERIYRAGLPQGSVLAPTLFLLWSAPLVASLRSVPGVSPFMYADDTAALCAGNDITTAKRRAQRAADALVHWARQSKMLVAGEKTQLLVLSQSAADAADCAIKQLRKLTGRSWGLEERQLRAVASGYVGGALLHAAAAWLPATPQSHVELLEREMRAAARTITGCPLSTPAHAVMAEAGLMPVAARRDVLAAKLLARAHALPEGDPLRAVAEGGPPSRLKTVTGWRGVGHDTWRAAGIVLPIETLLPARAPPWEVAACPHATFSLDIGALRRDAPPDELHQAAQRHLASLPQQASWVWTDGSADAGVRSGGGGAFVEWPDGATDELRVPAGQLCSSFRAEMVALRAALNHLCDHPHQPSAPITICSDSQSALATLREGPASQKTLLGAAIWTELAALAGLSRRIHLHRRSRRR